MNLIDKFFPNAYKVKKSYYKDGDETYLGSYEFTIIDDELDPFDVYINSGGMEINTDKYTHISLDKNNLLFLLEKIDEFEEENEI